jgi:hypothetical protein
VIERVHVGEGGFPLKVRGWGLSPDAVASPWVSPELAIALGRENAGSPAERILPVLLKDCTPVVNLLAHGDPNVRQAARHAHYLITGKRP